MIGATQAQSRVLRCIAAFQGEFGESPTYQEIADRLGVKSRGAIAGMIRSLETRGFLTRMPNLSRSLELTDKAWDRL